MKYSFSFFKKMKFYWELIKQNQGLFLGTFLYKRIVRFLLLAKISLNLSMTRSNCFKSSSGLGFSRNFTVFNAHLLNYFPKQCAASI